uniref:Uncharacterized protein n=1 Tax=Anguilla anguilla TaxID=7936 RepID=A0A0E9T4K0_ANGAN
MTRYSLLFRTDRGGPSCLARCRANRQTQAFLICAGLSHLK